MGDKLRQPSADMMMGWDALWSYFNSSYCTDEMRKWTFQHMNLVDALDGALPAVQLEIMTGAPQYIIRWEPVWKVLSSEARSVLGKSGNTSPVENTDDIRKAELRKRFNLAVEKLK